MKKFVINGIVDYIVKNKPCSKEDEEVIRYGISNLYLQISKIIVITAIAIILKLFVPYLIFTIIYNIIRMPSFGIHAKKSYQCWISSIILFIGIPFLMTILDINIYLKITISIISIIYITIYSPADTEKRPIVSTKRRLFYKYASAILSIIYAFSCLFIKDQIVSNALLFSLVLQSVIISPFTYKIFGQPYNNYKEYLRKEALEC
ncbi:MAG: accessory gene regulator B family protein [Bacilli bacterium]|nr:accessory gene regulator B family protein [Bacilli bacterium]